MTDALDFSGPTYIDARKIARCVRGCATDAQYIELVDGIAAALLAAREEACGYSEVFDAQKSVIEMLIETLQQIKRDNRQYNFGTKLVRTVDEALSKVGALKHREPASPLAEAVEKARGGPSPVEKKGYA